MGLCPLCAPGELCQQPQPAPSHETLDQCTIGRPVIYKVLAPVPALKYAELSKETRAEQRPKRISQIYENCLELAANNSLSAEKVKDTFSYILRISPLSHRPLTGTILWTAYSELGNPLCSYRRLFPLSYENSLANEEGSYVDLAQRAVQLYPDDSEISTLAHRILNEKSPQRGADGHALRDSKGHLMLPEWVRQRIAFYEPI